MASREIRLSAGDNVSVLIEQADGSLLKLELSLGALSNGASVPAKAQASMPAADPKPVAPASPAAPAAAEIIEEETIEEDIEEVAVAADLDDEISDGVIELGDDLDDAEIADEIELDFDSNDDIEFDDDDADSDDNASDNDDDEEEEELPPWTGRARDYKVKEEEARKAAAAEAAAAEAPASDEISLDGAEFDDDEILDEMPGSSMSAGECSVFLTPPRTPEKREAAAAILASVQGISIAEAKELTKKVIITVAKEISEFDAENVLEQIKEAGLLGRITRKKR